MTDSRVAGENTQAILTPTTSASRLAGENSQAVLTPDTSSRRVAGLNVQVLRPVNRRVGWGVILK